MCGGRAQPGAELLRRAADETREHRDRERSEAERQDRGRIPVMSGGRGGDQDDGDAELDEVAAIHVPIIEP